KKRLSLRSRWSPERAHRRSFDRAARSQEARTVRSLPLPTCRATEAHRRGQLSGDVFNRESEMPKNVSEQILERLAAWGVTHVFGYPGDGINGLMGAFNANDHGIDFLQARHEEMAAFMAVGYAKFTGRLGVCMATSGPGAIHLLNGLYDAKMDHQPVLAIVGQAARSAMGGANQQEVDLHTLGED